MLRKRLSALRNFFVRPKQVQKNSPKPVNQVVYKAPTLAERRKIGRPPQSVYGLVIRKTWTHRNIESHRSIAKALVAQNIKKVGVLNLGAGFRKGRSPTTINLFNILRKSKIDVESITSVDINAPVMYKEGISYVSEDVLSYVKKHKGQLPNIVLTQNLLEHFDKEYRKEFEKAIWEKLPENGFWVTSACWYKENGNYRTIDVVVQKVKGRSKVIAVNPNFEGAGGYGGYSEEKTKTLLSEWVEEHGPFNLDNYGV